MFRLPLPKGGGKMEREKEAATEYGTDLPPEVREKIAQEEQIRHLITEADIEDLQFTSVSGRPYLFVKRGLDILLSVLGLLALAIPLAVICGLIYLDDPGKVLFRQYRVGLHGKRFRLYKLRTMKAETPKYLSTQEVDDPNQYITRVGRVLRKLSIDELPQLFNVLRGDMSLVGPRPLISDEYDIHEMRMRFGVYNVRPGITGLAQVNGRDTVGPVEKVHWDIKYLQEFGLRMDAKILLETVLKALRGSDVVEGHIPNIS